MDVSKAVTTSFPATGFVSLVWVAILPALTGCDDAVPTTAETPIPKVTTAQVIQEETIDFDEYTGRTEASEAVEIRARVFGYLKTIEFQGRRLRQGRSDAVHDRTG